MSVTRRYLLLSGVLLLGLMLRLSNYPKIFMPEGVDFVGNDSYYHVLQAQQIAAVWPHIPAFDPQLHAPAGMSPLYPGGHAWLAATGALLLNHLGASVSVAAICAVIPLVYFLCWALLCLAAWRGPSIPALAAVALISFLPPSIEMTALGNFDHHGLELLFLMLSVVLAERFRRHTSVGEAISMGAIFGLMPIFWVQSPIFLFIWVLMVLPNKGWNGLCVPAVATLTYFWIVFGWGGKEIFEVNQLSLAQPLMGFLALLLAGIFTHGLRRIFGFLIVVGVAWALWFQDPWLNFWNEVRGTLLGQNPFLQAATESRPLTVAILMGFLFEYGLTLAVLPATFSSLGSTSLRRVFFVLLPLAYLQVRFFNWLIVPILFLVAAVFEKYWPATPYEPKAFFIRRRLVLCLLLPWSLVFFRPTANADLHPVFVAYKQACEFLKNQPVDSQLPNALTSWDYGHWLRFYSGRPSVTSPMTASRQARDWNAEAQRLFFKTDLKQVHEDLRRLQVGWVVAILPSSNFERMAQSLGDPGGYLSRDRHDPNSWVLLPKFFETLQARLTLVGLAPEPLGFKRVYISPQTVNLGGKIFPQVVIAQVLGEPPPAQQ